MFTVEESLFDYEALSRARAVPVYIELLTFIALLNLDLDSRYKSTPRLKYSVFIRN